MIFDTYMNNRLHVVKEADDDDDDYTVNDPDDEGGNNPPSNDGGDNPPEDQPQDDSGDEDDYTIQDDDDDKGGEGNAPEDNPDDQPQDDSGDEDDYTMNDPDDSGEDDDNPDGDPNNGDEDDNPDDSGEGDDESDDPRAKLNALEKSIFDQLSPEQQESKSRELKELFTLAYDKCDTIIDVVNNTPKAARLAKVYDYIVSRLTDLKKYITDYLSNVYDNKTYLENMSEFHKYLAVFDTVKNIFEDIQKESNKE